MNAEARLRELGLELPEVPKLVTKYVPTSSFWMSRREVIVENIRFVP